MDSQFSVNKTQNPYLPEQINKNPKSTPLTNQPNTETIPVINQNDKDKLAKNLIDKGMYVSN